MCFKLDKLLYMKFTKKDSQPDKLTQSTVYELVVLCQFEIGTFNLNPFLIVKHSLWKSIKSDFFPKTKIFLQNTNPTN